jgi:pimeloyl-ACP methyl ester carboxylesterase
VKLEAEGFVPLVFGELVTSLLLEFGPVVVRAPYDWRLSIPALGLTVRDTLATTLAESPTRKLVVVAHSMGGLVAAHAVHALAEADRRRVLGLIALGTPWRGSYEAARFLSGSGPLVAAFGDVAGLSAEEVTRVLQSLPGLVGLLPPTATALTPSRYAPGALGTTPGGESLLAEVAAMHRTPPAGTLAIVSGHASTVCGFTSNDGPDPVWGPGDGVVPLDSATCGGTLAFEMVADAHATLPLNPVVISKVVERIRQLRNEALPERNSDLGDLLAPLGDLVSDTGKLIRRWMTELGIYGLPGFALHDLLSRLPLIYNGETTPESRSTDQWLRDGRGGDEQATGAAPE